MCLVAIAARVLAGAWITQALTHYERACRVVERLPRQFCLCAVLGPPARRVRSPVRLNVRVQISKTVRFEVFKRDGFTCAYCGATPPDVTLEVDHIHPVSKGGTNDEDNLVTSCKPCNRGKAARTLDKIPQPLDDRAKEIAEREEQLRGYYEIMEARRERKEQETWNIARVFYERYGDTGILQYRLDAIKNFLRRLDYYEVLDAMEIATTRIKSKAPAFRYFCGVCWKKIRENADGEEE